MNRQQGQLLDIIVGIFGVHRWFSVTQFGAVGVTGFNVWSVIVAFVGAVMLLGLLRLVSGRGLVSR